MQSKSDFYEVLNVSREASSEEIKAAYRTRAKELHPDRNRSHDATAKFQQLQEAFSVLGSPERRQLYDQGKFAQAIDPSTKATEAEFDPVTCDGCKCISAQPRFVQYDRVISVIFASYRIRPAGVFCPSCASKRLFWNTLITGCIGWLGVWGFFWSLAGVIRNLCGGTRSAGLNSFVLARQGAYFLERGDKELAHALATESLEYFRRSKPADSDYELGKSGGEISRLILEKPISTRIRIRSRWSGWPIPARYALLGLVIPAIFWGVALKSSEDSAGTNRRSNYKYSKPTEDYVDVPGRDGHTYRVSTGDYRRLKPIYDRLNLQQVSLESRSAELKTRNSQLESQRVVLDTTSQHAVDAFNQRVDVWNLQNKNIKSELFDFDQEINSYNAELERVGRKIK